MGFKRTESDWSVHQRLTTDGHSIFTTSVDDILLASSSKEESNRAAEDISQVFETSHAEDVKHLLLQDNTLAIMVFTQAQSRGIHNSHLTRVWHGTLHTKFNSFSCENVSHSQYVSENG
jgi:hypothetical protein